MELRNEIIKRASEYLIEIEVKRKESIDNRRKALYEKNY